MSQARGKEELMMIKFKQLSPEKQQELLDFAEFLEQKTEQLIDKKEEDFFAIAGIWENRKINSNSLRQVAWGEETK